MCAEYEIAVGDPISGDKVPLGYVLVECSNCRPQIEWGFSWDCVVSLVLLVLHYLPRFSRKPFDDALPT